MLSFQPRPSSVIVPAVCLAAFSLPLTFTGGAVATPAVGADFPGSTASLAWITNAFMMAFGSTVMTAGTLADRFGRRKLFLWGTGGFALCALALVFSPSLVVLNVLRIAQGCAAAASLAGGMAALASVYDGPRRTQVFSYTGVAFGAGLASGPLIAGWLISVAGWHAVFLSGAVTGALAFTAGVFRLPESRGVEAGPPDIAGAVTFSAMLCCLTFGLTTLPSYATGSVTAPLALGSSVLFLLAFVRAERRASRPMLDLSLFRFPRFIGVQVLPVATCYCYIVLLVLLPQRFIGVDGMSGVQAGGLMLALSAPVLVIPPAAAALTRWISAGMVSAAGLMLAAAGLVLLATALDSACRACTVGALLLIGTGTALPWGLMDGLSVSVVPVSRAGMAAGIFSTVRVAGESIALAM